MLLAIILIIAVVLLLGGFRLLAASPAVRAATDLYRASTLTDEQVRRMARKYAAWADNENNLLPVGHPYTQRLLSLSEGFYNPERYNLGVYPTSDINAFACADGSIRVFSGLMDRMTDEELLAIIGHEMGHIVHRDTLRAMSNAYVASAARHAISAVGGPAGELSGSMLGDIALKLTGAKFSRNQEYAADDYAFKRTVQYGADPFAVSDALGKLASLAAGGASEPSSGKGGRRVRPDRSVSVRLGSMFSTHPDPAGRADRMYARARNFVRKYPGRYPRSE